MTMTLDGTAGMTAPQGAVYNGLATASAQASTSGTSIDFTNIPVWVKRITVMLNGVSTNGTSKVMFQLGSGTIQTTGYSDGGGATSGVTTPSVAATDSRTGSFTIVNLSGNLWVVSGVYAQVNGGGGSFPAGGSVTLTGTLDRVRITTVNGTDTFDAGTINIMYE